MRLRDKFLDFSRRQKLFSKKDTILIACSGGPDSVALSCLFARIKNLYQLKFYLVYIKHHWRTKEEISRDEKIVQQISRELKVPLTIVSLPHRPENEARARAMRYSALEKIARKLKVKKIATGHNCDDFAETVILNLARSGKPKGIPVCRELPSGVKIIRPLLAATRKEIRDFLLRERRDFGQDATNWEKKLRRNFIRWEIIPRLREINSRAVENIFSALGEKDL